MARITDFSIGDRLKVVDIDGDTFTGIASSILWEDETDGEEELSLETGNGMIGFLQNEIVEISRVSG